MRYGLFILICWLGISVTPTAASEVLLGVVDDVDREQGTVTLKVIDSSGTDDGQSVPEMLSVAVNPDRIPNGLDSGDTVRVWGAFVESRDMKTFRVDSIHRGQAGGHRNDPTGVRSRLGQGRQRGRMESGRSSGRR